METPDYTKYTIEELYDVRSKVNQDTFPDRYELILNEIEKRKEMGDILTKTSSNPFWKSDIPNSNTLSIWWCYTWRFTLSFILFYFVIAIAVGITNSYLSIDDETIKIISQISAILGNIILSFIFIKQAITKRYSKFDIHIVERKKI